MVFLMQDIPTGHNRFVPNRIRAYKDNKRAIKACNSKPGTYVLDMSHKLIAHNFVKVTVEVH